MGLGPGTKSRIMCPNLRDSVACYKLLRSAWSLVGILIGVCYS
jgi:hypothetical protein